jgi:hypothetical protein
MVPEEMAGVLELGIGGRFGLSKARDIEIGPVPDGTPVDLLANLNLLSKKAVPLLVRMKNELRTEADFAKFVDPLFELSTCPDFVVNRGHYFGTGLDGEAALSDQQKNDLIAFLATL